MTTATPGGVLKDVQQTLTDIFSTLTKKTERVAVAKEIRQIEHSLNQQKDLDPTTGNPTLMQIEATLMSDFKASAKAGQNLEELLALAQEIRAYEEEIASSGTKMAKTESGLVLATALPSIKP